MDEENTMSRKENASVVRRAKNIVWTAAEDYGYEPEFLSFWQDGEPDFYMNSIIGYAYKWYGSDAMSRFIESFNGSVHRDTYDGLLWFALENCAYQREVKERPLLKELRKEYAATFFEQEFARSRQQWMAQNSTVYALQAARCREILGEKSKLRNPREQQLYDGLTFTGELTSEQLISRVTDVLQRYYHYNGKPDLLTFSYRIIKYLHTFIQKAFPLKMVRSETLHIGMSSEKNRFAHTWGNNGITVGKTVQHEEKDHAYIEHCFGRSLYTEEETRRLDTLLCSGPHALCHIHFTDGQRGDEKAEDPAIRQTIRDAEKQRMINEKHYQERHHIYQNSIARLTEQIRNAILVYPQPLPVPARTGQLEVSQIWRALYLNDNRIFQEKFEEERPEFSVDLLLDGSASCLDYQELIAAQGYVIASSLQNCKIPVQVSCFSSLRGYTVLHRFFTYGETDKNSSIFSYFAAGWNRDGLALRGISHLMKDSGYKNKILILFTDASPNDDHKISAEDSLVFRDYSDKAGIEDTAREVRNLHKEGVHVLAILNGMFGDSEAASQIYGKDHFTRIEKMDQLSQAAGKLIQRQIQDLPS